MTRICIVGCFLMTIAGVSFAQHPCSQSSISPVAATVAALRSQLRAVNISDDMDTNVPADAQHLIPQLKAALAQAARATLTCRDAAADPKAIEREMATPLSANPPQPPSRLRDDEWRQSLHGIAFDRVGQQSEQFYAVKEVPNGYSMVNFGTTQDERCSGPDLRKKRLKPVRPSLNAQI